MRKKNAVSSIIFHKCYSEGFQKIVNKLQHIKNTQCYITNVNDTAAMRDFYSPIEDMSLDDTITQHEAQILQKYLSSLRELPDIVKDVHTKGLAKVYQIGSIPEFYLPFTWMIKKNSNYNFILPDCVSIVVTEENALPAPFESEDENCAILFPLAKDILLVGQKGTFEADISKFNLYAAENTSDAFFCHPQFTPPHELQNMIGSKMFEFTSKESKNAVENYFEENNYNILK